jgi:NAD(P) transhydrogenase subunit alpha
LFLNWLRKKTFTTFALVYMLVVALKETRPYEKRVAISPDSVARLKKLGYDVGLEKGAGENAGYSNFNYSDSGAMVLEQSELLKEAAVILCAQMPEKNVINAIAQGSTIIGMLSPLTMTEEVKLLCEKKVTAFSLEFLPRISRAQSMDVLSSQATVSGYIAALDAAISLPKFFPMFMTAAGTIPPAKVFIIGAGVAGLQAIATARRLGANVKAYDVRSAAKEEVQSLGATFVDLNLETQEGEGGYAKEQSEEFIKKQQALMKDQIASSDAVITTAQIPQRKAPTIVTQEMVEAMAPGTVIVDLAAESGGNCELSKPGEVIMHNSVKIIGAQNYPSRLPTHASFLLARNYYEFLNLATKDGNFQPDFNDEIIAQTCVIKEGSVVNQTLKEMLKEG